MKTRLALLYGPPEMETSTSNSLDQCKAWLQNCEQSHACGRAADELEARSLPTRLVAIEGDDARLCADTSSLPPTTRYTSLSHCWGTQKFLTLTKSNLPELVEGIPTAALSRTFKHAILVAQYLGFKYIWIDSLCIIQDDADDWLRESVRMGGVYGQSALNIAATGASDGTVGCFFDRREDWRSQVILGNSDACNGTLWECFQHEVLWPPEEEVPLLSRAWVVQERFLAPRTLHFGKQQVFWTCEAVTACEMWPGGIPRMPASDPVECWFDPLEGGICRASWPSIVERYSRCKLTFGTDKL